MKHIEKYNITDNPIRFINKYETIGKPWNIFHAHHGMEFLYILEGKGSVLYGQQIFPFESGTLLYFQPFQFHGTKVEFGTSTKYIRTMLVVEPSFLEGYLNQFPSLKEFFHFILKGQLHNQIIPNANKEGVLENLFAYYSHILKNTSQNDNKEILVALTLSFLHLIKSIWSDPKPDVKNKNERTSHHAEKIMEWIELNYKDEFQLSKMEQELHISRHHLSHLFKEVTGVSITDYLIARRMREACFLLKTSTMPIENIGQEIGLTNFPYFCQFFKKHIGTTPLKYRNTKL